MTTENLAPHRDEDTKPYNRVVQYREESIRKPKIAFQE